MNGDDELLFVDEADEEGDINKNPWKILIADDEDEVHVVTSMVLEGVTFEQRGLLLLDAYSGKDTKQLMQEHPDMAVLLLDVVMEEDNTGLEVVRYIREKLENTFVRIILRTGQPGQAPERQVTIDYDINDYKEKTELTSQKLFTTVLAALRAYRDLRILEKNREGLEQIVAASANLFKPQSLRRFATGVLLQITALLHFDEDSLYLQAGGLAMNQKDGAYYVLAGTGQFEQTINKPVHDVVSQETFQLLMQAAERKQSFFTADSYIGYFQTQTGLENLIYLQGRNDLNDLDKNLLNIFSTNVSVAFDNIYLNQEIENTQKEVIFTLGEVVGTRCMQTESHARRVATYAHLLALKAGLTEEEAELLRLSSPLHDVGKLGIPDTILNKQNNLTEEEFKMIATHPIIGYDLFKGAKQKTLQTAAIIALQHYERWDGKGYPNGLQGEQIHIFARITKLADVFDSLSHRTRDQEVWNKGQIQTFFRKESGTLLDPGLVQLFLDNMDEFMTTKDQYAEHPAF